jgi:hypothetical protein
MDAFKTLSAFAPILNSLEDEETANMVVGTLSNMFAGEVRTEAMAKLNNIEYEVLMVEALNCVTSWFMNGTWLYKYPRTKSSLISAIFNGLAIRKSAAPKATSEVPEAEARAGKDKKGLGGLISRKSVMQPKAPKPNPAAAAAAAASASVPRQSAAITRREPGPVLREVASYTLLTLLNNLACFPNNSRTSSISSLITEDDIVPLLANELPGTEPGNFVRFFFSGSTLFTLIDRPNNGDPYLTIIVRDKTGRYVWDMIGASLAVDDEPLLAKSVIIHPEAIHLHPFVNPTPEKSEQALSTVFSYLGHWNNDELVRRVTDQAAQETRLLQSKQYGLAHDIRCQPAQPQTEPYKLSRNFLQGRLFLSNLGQFSTFNRHMCSLVNQCPAFYAALQQLDQLPERETYSAGVIYIKKGQSEQDIYSNESGSLQYQQFLTTLGWTVNIGSHVGYLGGLDKNGDTGKVTPYYADYNKEMVFHTATLISNRSDLGHKRQLVGSSEILIVWHEDEPSQYNPSMFSASVHILISPLPSGLYYVRTLNQSYEPTHIGPLLDGSVVGLSILGTLVRDTAITACKSLRSLQPNMTHPYVVRQQFLSDMATRFGMPTLNVEKFFNIIFSPLPKDQLYPSSPISRQLNLALASQNQLLVRRPRARAGSISPTDDWKVPTAGVNSRPNRSRADDAHDLATSAIPEDEYYSAEAPSTSASASTSTSFAATRREISPPSSPSLSSSSPSISLSSSGSLTETIPARSPTPAPVSGAGISTSAGAGTLTGSASQSPLVQRATPPSSPMTPFRGAGPVTSLPPLRPPLNPAPLLNRPPTQASTSTSTSTSSPTGGPAAAGGGPPDLPAFRRSNETLPRFDAGGPAPASGGGPAAAGGPPDLPAFRRSNDNLPRSDPGGGPAAAGGPPELPAFRRPNDSSGGGSPRSLPSAGAGPSSGSGSGSGFVPSRLPTGAAPSRPLPTSSGATPILGTPATIPVGQPTRLPALVRPTPAAGPVGPGAGGPLGRPTPAGEAPSPQTPARAVSGGVGGEGAPAASSPTPTRASPATGSGSAIVPGAVGRLAGAGTGGFGSPGPARQSPLGRSGPAAPGSPGEPTRAFPPLSPVRRGVGSPGRPN